MLQFVEQIGFKEPVGLLLLRLKCRLHLLNNLCVGF
jgi:hypothetical protein